MKIQNIVFLVVLAWLIMKHRGRNFVIAGILCLLFSIPLFSLWVFFTAERLTWYAAAFFFSFCLFSLKNSH